MTILEALRDGRLLGALPAFSDLRSWAAWIAFEKARVGIPLSAEELMVFRRQTERREPRAGGYPIALAITGRQCGKTRWLATGAAFAAATAENERGAFVTLVGQDLRAAQRAAFSYVREVFALPVFRSVVVRETADTIELSNGLTLAVYPCRSSAVRGVRNLCAFMDEAAHFISSEGRPADVEMYRALTPTLLTTGGRLVIATSPYAMSGLVWEMYRKHWAADSDTLIWQGDSLSMNPSLDTAALQRMREDDPEGAESEVEGRFRRGLSMLLDADALHAVTDAGVRERLPQQETRYSAHFDASGGRSDAAALAVAHRDRDSVTLDCLRRWPAPHNPETVIAEAAEVVRSFNLSRVQIDRFAGEFPVSAFERHRIRAEVARRTTTDHYLGLLPIVNAGKVRLLDHPDLLRELRALERRRGTAGRDTVAHPRGRHDDCAASVAGVVSLLSGRDPDDGGITFGNEEHVAPQSCPVCSGQRTLGTGSAEAPLTSCFACSGDRDSAMLR